MAVHHPPSISTWPRPSSSSSHRHSLTSEAHHHRTSVPSSKQHTTWSLQHNSITVVHHRHSSNNNNINQRLVLRRPYNCHSTTSHHCHNHSRLLTSHLTATTSSSSRQHLVRRSPHHPRGITRATLSLVEVSHHQPITHQSHHLIQKTGKTRHPQRPGQRGWSSTHLKRVRFDFIYLYRNFEVKLATLLLYMMFLECGRVLMIITSREQHQHCP